MTQPGSPASAMPADEATTLRRIADLERQMRELAPSIADSFGSTVAHLRSLVTVGEGRPSLSTGTVPGDSTRRWFDTSSPASVTVNAPTGRVLITVACGEASLNPGNSTAIAYASFQISGPTIGTWWPVGTSTARLFLTSRTGHMGVPLSISLPVDVQNWEPVTVTAKFGLWSSSATSLASCEFANPYINVQVIESA